MTELRGGGLALRRKDAKVASLLGQTVHQARDAVLDARCAEVE